MTHTMALMTLSQAAFLEITEKMMAAGYDQAFADNGVIDMHGVGVMSEVGKPEEPPVMVAGIKEGGELEKAVAALDEIHIVFDGPPGPTAGRFVEVNNAFGRSVGIGRWEERGAYWHLILPPLRAD